MLSATLGYLGDMSHRSVLALEVAGFSQGSLLPCLKVFRESGHNNLFTNIMENMK